MHQTQFIDPLAQIKEIFLKLIHLIAAARPNFMKIAPLYHALKKEDWVTPFLIHTGQHYDWNMSDVFFQELGLPTPNIHLGIGSGSHAEQTAQVMVKYEKIVLENKPDLVVVVGDVNSTMAVAIASSKLNIPIAHLEAGLRSFDRTMPEEINRIITDTISNLLWTPSKDADENLYKEGVTKEKICRVGNIMIDSLELMRPKILSEDIVKKLHLEHKNFAVITLHRPSNVDNTETLQKITQILLNLSKKLELVFPIHPRTKKNLEQNGLLCKLQNHDTIHLLEPQSYTSFMNLIFYCKLVITDSGGVQEETSYLGVPCLTLRPNTERPITITHGTNRLCSLDNLESKVADILARKEQPTTTIELWDGNVSKRVVTSMKKFLGVL